MSTVSDLPSTGNWTVDDLATLPDDVLQYELLDGVLLVSPAPRLLHQRAAGRLYVLLANAVPDTVEVFFARDSGVLPGGPGGRDPDRLPTRPRPRSR